MLRVKRVHRLLVSYVVLVYLLLVLIYQTVGPGAGDLETVLSYDNYTWARLSDELWVLSAHHEARAVKNSPFVRIITIAKHKKDKLVRLSPRELWPKLYSDDAFQVSCEVWDEAGERVTSNPEVIIFDERGELFASTFINCPLEPGSSPSQVTLRSNGSSVTLPVNSLIQSKDSDEVIPHRREGATCVCVRALYGPYNNLRQMGQFISFYSAVLGAKMFTFYLLDATDKIKFLLGELQQMHSELGITIRVVDWALDPRLKSWEAIWDYGALSLLTDCVYSNMADYEYAYIVDMDEFIVPAIDLDGQKTQDLVNMIGRFKKPPANKRSDSFLFKNSFFCGEYNNDKVSDPHSDENFDIFRSTFREDYIWSYKLRAKMLVRTSEVVAVGHHMIHSWVSQNVSYNTPVPEQVALLNHYRDCEGLHSGYADMGPPVLNNRRRADRSVGRYEQLVRQSPVHKLLETILG